MWCSFTLSTEPWAASWEPVHHPLLRGGLTSSEHLFLWSRACGRTWAGAQVALQGHLQGRGPGHAPSRRTAMAGLPLERTGGPFPPSHNTVQGRCLDDGLLSRRPSHFMILRLYVWLYVRPNHPYRSDCCKSKYTSPTWRRPVFSTGRLGPAAVSSCTWGRAASG